MKERRASVFIISAEPTSDMISEMVLQCRPAVRKHYGFHSEVETRASVQNFAR